MSEMKTPGASEHVSEENPESMFQTENSMPSPKEEEEAIRKKYGGIIPKKTPLISMDHERAFFDSADWALGKQGAPVEKPKGPVEALRPKLEPTKHNQVRSRRLSHASADSEDGSNAFPDTNAS